MKKTPDMISTHFSAAKSCICFEFSSSMKRKHGAEGIIYEKCTLGIYEGALCEDELISRLLEDEVISIKKDKKTGEGYLSFYKPLDRRVRVEVEPKGVNIGSEVRIYPE